jgi:hypothetical protein
MGRPDCGSVDAICFDSNDRNQNREQGIALAVVLVFLIAGLLFAPRARRSLGAYRIPLETGLLIPSE